MKRASETYEKTLNTQRVVRVREGEMTGKILKDIMAENFTYLM